jgi:LacI family transcriptional regulator
MPGYSGSVTPSRRTLAHVAAEAGVSVPTVSKVLNDRPDVGEPTRRLVQEAIARTGYAPRAAAKRRQRAGLVDVVVHSMKSPWVLEVLAGAEEAARLAGVGLVVTAAPDPTHDAWVRTVTSRRSDGVVLVVTDISADMLSTLRAKDVPVVVVDRTGNTAPGLASIGAANWSGALSATEHLISLGHRRIGMISGHPRLACSAERIDGFHAALRRAGLPVDDSLVLHGDFFPEGGRAGAKQLLDLADPPTAIFAGSDLQALGVYEEASRRGLRVPDDLSVVGFDDLSLARYVTPPLTTVRQPHSEMAAEAVRLVLSMSRGDQPPPPTRVELSTNLVVRASTREHAG